MKVTVYKIGDVVLFPVSKLKRSSTGLSHEVSAHVYALPGREHIRRDALHALAKDLGLSITRHTTNLQVPLDRERRPLK